MDANLDYVAHLAAESLRFGDVISGVPSGAPVPTCPDWDADDLLWHLGWVQSWWGTIVRDHVDGPQARETLPARPIHRGDLLTFFHRSSRELPRILAAAAPETRAWTWSADQTVGFIRRKQAHEALIHRVDAEIVAGRRSPMDAPLSADGVDEALRIMYGDIPDWGSFTPIAGATMRIHATDTGDRWLVELGRFTGTDADGMSYDEPDIRTGDHDPGGPTTATTSGRAADLDCWLWHRPPVGPIGRSGDIEAIRHFESAIAPGIN